MKTEGAVEVEPTSAAVASWTERCNDSAEGKVWLKCNNWYTKSTKTDTGAGRKRSRLMWMESYENYLAHLYKEEGGSHNELLNFSAG